MSHQIINEVEPDVYGELGKMKTTPVKIVLRDEAVPYSLLSPRCITIPVIGKVKDKLERMEKLDIISKADEPTEWFQWSLKSMISVNLKKFNKSV